VNFNNSIREAVFELNLNNIELFSDEQYYFQDEIDSSNIESNNSFEIIQKFLRSYLTRINHLSKIDAVQSSNFINWYNKDGKENLIPLFEQVSYEKLNINRLKKILINYDILLEQAIYDKNVGSLLNLLIDIPKGIYSKLQQWNCIASKVNIYSSNC
jgi:hypothetical protein